MDAFFSITIIVILVRWWWNKSHPLDDMPPQVNRKATKSREEKQREKDIRELRKQGYDDELITTILPVINNDK